MEKWILNPNEIDFGSGSSSPITTSAPVPYAVENAVHLNGELQFYANDGIVYDANGNWAGQYVPPGHLKELAIAPGPGSCNTWCLFWLETSPLSTLNLLYQEVSVDQYGNISFGFGGEAGEGLEFGNTGGIAIAQAPPDAGALNRDVFFVGPSGIHKFLMTGLSVNYIETIPVETGGNRFICEADLSHDGTKLCWGNENRAYIYDFVNLFTLTLPDAGNVYGVEFAPGNESIYISHATQGLVQWGPDIGPFQVEKSAVYGRTQLEMALDGRVYAVSDAGALGAIQGTTVSPSNYNITVNSGEGSVVGIPYFALPDQIDGEDYSHFTGIAPPMFDDFNVNGEEVFDFIDPMHPPLLVYNCAPIELNTSIPGNLDSYSIHIFSTDPTTGQQVTGPNFLDATFQGMGAPDPAIDLRCLQDPVNCDLFTDFINPPFNTFTVEMTLNGRCESVSRLGHIEVQDAPEEAQIGLAVNNTITGIPCPASHDIQSPCPAGIFSASINLANSNGDITYYQVVIEEVNCSNGSPTANLFDSGQVPVNGVSSLTALALNAFEINGATGFFADPVWLNRCLRITATVGNPCGESTDFTFLKFDGQYLGGPGDGGRSSLLASGGKDRMPGVSVFPNPFGDELTVSLQLPEGSPVTVSVFDATGKLVKLPFEGVSLPPGNQQLTFEAGGLSPGIYFVKVASASEVHTSQIVKFK